MDLIGEQCSSIICLKSRVSALRIVFISINIIDESVLECRRNLTTDSSYRDITASVIHFEFSVILSTDLNLVRHRGSSFKVKKLIKNAHRVYGIIIIIIALD